MLQQHCNAAYIDGNNYRFQELNHVFVVSMLIHSAFNYMCALVPLNEHNCEDYSSSQAQN